MSVVIIIRPIVSAASFWNLERVRWFFKNCIRDKHFPLSSTGGFWVSLKHFHTSYNVPKVVYYRAV